MLLATNEELRKALASRGKETRVLKDITNQLIGDAENEIKETGEWALRKTAMVQNAKQAVEAASLVDDKTILTQQVETTVDEVDNLLSDSKTVLPIKALFGLPNVTHVQDFVSLIAVRPQLIWRILYSCAMYMI